MSNRDFKKDLLSVAKFVTGVSSDLSTAKSTAQGHKYRASLAEENARRGSILHLERAEKLKKEGLLDVGLFMMRMDASGLSGVSAEMWNRQRQGDTLKEIETAQSTRSSVVQRFLREQQWSRQNATNSASSGKVSAFGRALTLGSDLWKD
ncbi:hypothetical protein HUT03_02100 [Candidatus Liberibacter africanus]|uniref:hypothetical protein n=1 Tax=Liberibacter africanus TaxID=34020 RepID=UPI001AE48E5F|nr:hypothetical protein [Candidatus Liberibacter africanus]QTP63877.1 hypothetical protein HUT03_02100 [Candidatus Liberibacter africanus]